MTGLFNRGEFFRQAEKLLATLAEEKRPAAVLLMDLDHFKRINDTHGHRTGDEMLVLFAGIVNDTFGCCGLCCRYGGEEFAAILPDMTSSEAVAQAEKLRTAFSTAGSANSVQATVSIGVVSAPAKPSLSELLERADKQLYLAKASGRDRTVADLDFPEVLRRRKPPLRTFGERVRTARSA